MRAAVASLLLLPALAFADDSSDPWPREALSEPSQIAATLGQSGGTKPAVFYVGFPNLYSGAHLRGAMLAGPGSKPAGLDRLREASGKLSRSQPITIYCGCCPFEKCPNIRPAYRLLKEQGFTDIRVMHVPTNLHTDWVAKGFPTVRGNLPQ